MKLFSSNRRRKKFTPNSRQLDDDPQPSQPARTSRAKVRNQVSADESGDAERPRPTCDPAKVRTRTVQRAVKLLAAKPRAIGELRERLAEKEWATPDAIEYALVKLQEYGYLDDAQYAQSFALSRVRGKPMGRSRVARDLGMKKIDKETADAALDKVFEETSEENLIDEAIRRYTQTRGAPTDRAAQKRLFDFLMRRGFSFDLIQPRVRAAVSASDEDADDAGT